MKIKLWELICLALLIALVVGCAIHADVDMKIGYPDKVKADLTTVQRLVCRGDIVGAEGLLTARGYDTASMIEAIERAKIKCETTKK